MEVALALVAQPRTDVSSFAVMVSAAGRNFYIFDESVPGVIRYEPTADVEKDEFDAWTPGKTGLTRHCMAMPFIPEKWTLIARDAFSGVLLWKRPLPDWGSKHTRTIKLRYTSSTVQRTLVASGDHLFTTDGFRGPAAVLDASSGKVLERSKIQMEPTKLFSPMAHYICAFVATLSPASLRPILKRVRSCGSTKSRKNIQPDVHGCLRRTSGL